MTKPGHPTYPAHIWPVSRDANGLKTRCLVACGGCGEEASFPRFPVEVTVQYLTQRGYQNPGDPRRCRCPACVIAAREQRAEWARSDSRVTRALAAPPSTPKPKEALLMSVTPIPSASKPKADAPRTATPADNARIHEELLAKWDSKRGCYQGALNDAAVAESLKVPRAWVASVRAMFFGEDTCAAKLEAPAQLGALKAEVKKLESEALDLATRAEALGKRIDDIAKAVA